MEQILSIPRFSATSKHIVLYYIVCYCSRMSSSRVRSIRLSDDLDSRVVELALGRKWSVNQAVREVLEMGLQVLEQPTMAAGNRSMTLKAPGEGPVTFGAEVNRMADHPFVAQKTSAFRCEACGHNRAYHSKEA